jgi:hypothetical protein
LQDGQGICGDELLLLGIATQQRVAFRVFRSDDPPERMGLYEATPLNEAVKAEVMARGRACPIAFVNYAGNAISSVAATHPSSAPLLPLSWGLTTTQSGLQVTSEYQAQS